jgi:hypothetical protein
MADIPPDLPANSYIFLELTKALVPALVTIVGGLFVAYRYITDQRHARDQESKQANQENIARLIEARKPFAAIQLQLFIEAGKIAGQLAAFDKSTLNWMENDAWKSDYARFYQLFWTELSIVEDEGIKVAMQDFSRQLKKVVSHPTDLGEQKQLNNVAYRLALAIRGGIEKMWVLDLDRLTERKME